MMDLMCPFYDWQHVDICLNTLVSCITTKARNFSSLLKLAFRNKATKKDSVVIGLATKRFQLPLRYQPKTFYHQTCGPMAIENV